MGETYGQYRLPELWRMVADEDPEAGFAHVNALNRLRTALEQQRDNLRVQRDRLIAGWSPERSEAAAAFVDRINGMIDVLTFTARAAGRVCAGVDAVFATVREARRDLEPMMADYAKRATGAGLVTTNAGDAQLDARGRNIMIAADGKVAEASGLINSSIPGYKRIDDSGETVTQSPAGANGSGPSTTGGTSSSSTQSALLRPPVFDPPLPGGGLEPSVDGPVLAGNPIAVGTPGGDGQPGLGSLGPSGGTVIGSVQPSLSPTSRAGLPPAIVGPGGVIGLPRPTGGMQHGGAPSGGAAPAARGTGGMPLGYRDRSYEQYAAQRSAKRGDENELWPVAEGVAPVIEAPAERRHYPGPGVFGIDR